MRAHEFILNEKRRKKRKARSVTGPYYGYYYGLGTTTDSGVEGGDGGGMEEGELIPWPKGTVKVDVSDVYDWYKLGQHISNLKGLGKHDFGKGPPQTVMAFGSEPLEHEYIKDLNKIGLKTYDIDEDVTEGKMAELDMDLEDPEITDRQFEKIYGMTRKEARELFSRTNMWDFPQVRDPDRPLHEQGVAESLDSPYSYHWEEGDFGDLNAYAQLSDNTVLDIEFEQINVDKSQWTVGFQRDGQIHKTGKGDEQRVFATVLSAIKEFIENKQPKEVFFSAEKSEVNPESRKSLYDRLVQKYATALGYQASQSETNWGTKYKFLKIREQGVAEDSENNLNSDNIAALLRSQSSYGDGQDGDILMHATTHLVRNLKYDRQKAVNLIYKTPLGDQIVQAYHELRRQGVAEENLTEFAPSPLHHKLDPVLKQLSLKENLNENISPVVYHYTRIGPALKILQSGEFKLSSVLGSVEQEYAPKGYPYFLSTTRTRRGGYHRSVGSTGVLFVLDGTWFNQRYPGGSIDYWLNRNPQLSHHREHEAEDRVFSRDPTISITGVTGLHVYITSDAYPDQLAQARQLLIAAKRLGIDTQLYRDETAWRNFDTRNTADVGQLRGQERTGGRISTHPGYLLPWIQLLTTKDKSQLNKDADKIRYSLAYTYNREDAARRLNTDLSNARKPDSGPDREHAVKIIQFMRRNNLDTVKDLVAVLAKKWQPEDKKVSENFADGEHTACNYRLQEAGPLKIAGQVAAAHSSANDVVSRFQRGDYAGAGIGALSAIANLKPGLGTAVSLGLDYINDQRDKQNSVANLNKPEVQSGTANDEIKPINPDAAMQENFADGRNPGRKGLAKRVGVPTKASVTRLRQIAKSSSGEKQRMAHWMANMKAGRKK